MEMEKLEKADVKRPILFDLPGAFFKRELSPKQKFIKLTSHWIELTGYSIEESFQMDSFFDLIYIDDRERVSRIIEDRITKLESWIISYRLLTNEGDYKWVEEKGTAIQNESSEIIYLEGYINEIYPEEDSLFKDLSYQKAVNSSSVVSITDKVGTILYVNELFCKYSGYSKEELIGQNHRIVNSNLHPKSFFKELWDTINSGKTWRGEIRNISRDGRYYWVDTVITPIFGKEGEIVQFLSVRNIISEKKHTEYIVKHIYEGLTIKSGESFFTNITEFCCKVLQVEYAYVGWYNDVNQTVETISFKKDGEEIEKAYFNINGTPCLEVKNKRTISYSNNAQRHYPEATKMQEMEIQSYLGLPLLNDKDEVLGLLVLMDTKPMNDLFDKQFILNFITPRIGNEIHSWIVDNKLKEIEFQTKSLLASLYTQIGVMDETGEILYTEGMFDYSKIQQGNSVEFSLLSFNKEGINYVEQLEYVIENSSDSEAKKMYNGIAAIRKNDISKFQMNYSYSLNGENNTCLLNVSRLNDSSNKLVISSLELI